MTKLACSDATPTVAAHGSGGTVGAGGSATAGSATRAGASSGGSAAIEGGGASNGGVGGDGLATGGTMVSGTIGGGGTGGGTDDWTLPADATLASCIPANWTVSATTSADSNPPAYAIDGVPSTRWSSGQGQDAVTYYQIDFGGWVTLKQVVLDNSAGSADDYPRGYEIRASKDGINFTKVVASGTLATAPDGGVLSVDFDPVPTQSLRIGTTISSGNWWSVDELRLSCQGADDGTPPPDPLLCTPGDSPGAGGAGGAGGQAGDTGVSEADPFNHANWTATASETNASDSAQGAFDGSLSTRWSTGAPQIGTEWYLLDLGSVACVSSLWMVSGGGDFATNYSIEVSVDGVTYEQVAKGAGAPVTQLQFKSHSARFIRINQVGVGGAHWWSIQELEVQP